MRQNVFNFTYLARYLGPTCCLTSSSHFMFFTLTGSIFDGFSNFFFLKACESYKIADTYFTHVIFMYDIIDEFTITITFNQLWFTFLNKILDQNDNNERFLKSMFFLTITWLGNYRLTITASCPMNLQYFPMDRQLCYIEIESCKLRLTINISNVRMFNFAL